jgi:hypothetical protein
VKVRIYLKIKRIKIWKEITEAAVFRALYSALRQARTTGGTERYGFSSVVNKMLRQNHIRAPSQGIIDQSREFQIIH